jgi:hypothetical protein
MKIEERVAFLSYNGNLLENDREYSLLKLSFMEYLSSSGQFMPYLSREWERNPVKRFELKGETIFKYGFLFMTGPRRLVISSWYLKEIKQVSSPDIDFIEIVQPNGLVTNYLLNGKGSFLNPKYPWPPRIIEHCGGGSFHIEKRDRPLFKGPVFKDIFGSSKYMLYADTHFVFVDINWWTMFSQTNNLDHILSISDIVVE